MNAMQFFNKKAVRQLFSLQLGMLAWGGSLQASNSDLLERFNNLKYQASQEYHLAVEDIKRVAQASEEQGNVRYSIELYEILLLKDPAMTLDDKRTLARLYHQQTDYLNAFNLYQLLVMESHTLDAIDDIRGGLIVLENFMEDFPSSFLKQNQKQRIVKGFDRLCGQLKEIIHPSAADIQRQEKIKKQLKNSSENPVVRGEEPEFGSEVMIEQLIQQAEQGDVTAQYDLGEIYNYGLFGEISWEKALKWYQNAADQGDPLAHEKLMNKIETKI